MQLHDSLVINAAQQFSFFLSLCVEPGLLSWYSYSPRAGRSGDRIPVGARFPAPVQTASEAHPASYRMGTGSFPGIKRPGHAVDLPPHLAPRLMRE